MMKFKRANDDKRRWEKMPEFTSGPHGIGRSSPSGQLSAAMRRGGSRPI